MSKTKLQPQLMRAGAGTGKTSSLIGEVYRLFKEFKGKDQREPRLIVCTFTRKACQELKERLFEKAVEEINKSCSSKALGLRDAESKFQAQKEALRASGLRGPESEAQAQKEPLKESGLRSEAQAQKEPLKESELRSEAQAQKEPSNKEDSSSLFLSYVQSPSLCISTIDGILNLFLRRYAYRIALSPDFQLSSSEVNGELFDSMAPSFLFQEPSPLLGKLPYPYLKNLFLFYFNCRLKYGEVSFYDRKDFKDFQEDWLSFSKQAESPGGRKNKGSLLSRSKPQAAEFLGKSERNPLFENQAEPLKKLFSQGWSLEDVKSLFNEEESFQADHFIPLFEEFKSYAEKFFPLFLEKKKSGGLLDMEDLFLFSLALLRESPQTGDDFSGQWDYWLIDEYQDTSWMQEQIIQKITKFKNVFCVGDPGQSIYLFRSADPLVFKRREEALKGDTTGRDTGNHSSSGSADRGNLLGAATGRDTVNHSSSSSAEDRGRGNLLGIVTRRDINYRSSSELIHFYNDFFPEESGFMKCKPPEGSSLNKEKSSSDFTVDRHKGSSLNKEKSSIHFFTYDKRSKIKYGPQALKALALYIQSLKAGGCSYSDIAVLSSKNEDLSEIASFLRSRRLPLCLYSSQNFAKKRLIRDALFLLKFLINPFDSSNLKALLRTPYFRLSDQELADSSCEHYKLAKQKQYFSFWSVIKKNFPERLCIKSLSLYLEEKKAKGLLKALERALLDSGLMEFSYLQDPTGSSEADLWKCLYLLNKEKAPPLSLFYALHEEKEGDFDEAEAPFEAGGEALRLMTIHKSKGLEFKHVILMDSSVSASAFRTGGEQKSAAIYDKQRRKMSFAAPIGGRDKKKVKPYAHKLCIKQKSLESRKEKERVFYVAMTRAKESLAVFIPNSPPEKNSWLEGIAFFERDCFRSEESQQPLLEKECDPKNANRVKLWKLNEGFYKTKLYSFCVQSVDSFKAVISAQAEIQPSDSESRDLPAKDAFPAEAGSRPSDSESRDLPAKDAFPVEARSRSSDSESKDLPAKDAFPTEAGSRPSDSESRDLPAENIFPAKSESGILSAFERKRQKELSIFTGGKQYFESSSFVKTVSSKDFINEGGEEGFAVRNNQEEEKSFAVRNNQEEEKSFAIRNNQEEEKSFAVRNNQEEEKNFAACKNKGDSDLESLPGKKTQSSKAKTASESKRPESSLENNSGESLLQKERGDLPADNPQFGEYNLLQKKRRESVIRNGGKPDGLLLQKERRESARHRNISLSSELSQKEREESSFSFHKEKNILFKTYLGNHLHFFLKKLSFQPLDQVQSLVESSFLLKKDKEKMKEALAYIYELKEIPMKLFLKKGFAEWPFKLKDRGLLFQGQVDLWVWDGDFIHVFDYKSSESKPHQTKRQLIFYSWVLQKLYQPKKLYMHALYPFQKKTVSSLYGDREKSAFESLLDSRPINRS